MDSINELEIERIRNSVDEIYMVRILSSLYQSNFDIYLSKDEREKKMEYFSENIQKVLEKRRKKKEVFFK